MRACVDGFSRESSIVRTRRDAEARVGTTTRQSRASNGEPAVARRTTVSRNACRSGTRTRRVVRGVGWLWTLGSGLSACGSGFSALGSRPWVRCSKVRDTNYRLPATCDLDSLDREPERRPNARAQSPEPIYCSRGGVRSAVRSCCTRASIMSAPAADEDASHAAVASAFEIAS